MADIPQKHKYNEIGMALEAHDFEFFNKKIHQYVEAAKNGDKADLEILQEHQHGLPSQLDMALFCMAQYGVQNSGGENSEKISYYPNALETVKLLLENDANPNAIFEHGVTPVMKMCEKNCVNMLSLCIENQKNSANIDQANGKGHRPLLYAVLSESLDTIKFLITECHADVNFKYVLSHGQTVLHFACSQAKEHSMDMLINLGSNPNIRDKFDNLPGEIIPVLNEEIESVEDFPEGELEKWDRMFEKISKYTTQFKETTKIVKKNVF